VQLLAVAALFKSSHGLPESFSAYKPRFPTLPVIPPRPGIIFIRNFIISHPYYSPLPTHFYTLIALKKCSKNHSLAHFGITDLLNSPYSTFFIPDLRLTIIVSLTAFSLLSALRTYFKEIKEI